MSLVFCSIRTFTYLQKEKSKKREQFLMYFSFSGKQNISGETCERLHVTYKVNKTKSSDTSTFFTCKDALLCTQVCTQFSENVLTFLHRKIGCNAQFFLVLHIHTFYIISWYQMGKKCIVSLKYLYLHFKSLVSMWYP